MRPWHRVTLKLIGLALLAIGVGVFVMGAFDSWMLRDSLGPRGVESRGLEAAVRFAKGFSEFLYISVGFWAAGWLLLRRSP